MKSSAVDTECLKAEDPFSTEEREGSRGNGKEGEASGSFGLGAHPQPAGRLSTAWKDAAPNCTASRSRVT